jgi:hypothetical protein
VTEYLNAYYGEYANAVQQVIDYYQNAYANAGATIVMSGSYSSALTKEQHETAAAYLDGAIAAANDATMLQRLKAVKASCLAPIAYRYATLVGECPTGFLGGWSTSKDESWRDTANSWYTNFFELCEAGNISHFAETVTLATAKSECMSWVQEEYNNAQ